MTKENGGEVTDEAVEWGYRLLAGRPPVSAVEAASFRALPDLDTLRRTFANLPEFHAFFGAIAQGFQSWQVPMFLLRPSVVDGLEWRFVPPDLEQPCSQMCTWSQFDDPAYAEIIEAMGYPPGRGRPRWEQAWIVSVLATEGLVAPGKRGLGLQVGRERVPSLLASRGVEVVGTNDEVGSPAAAETRRTWLFHPEVCHIEEFDRLVRFAGLDWEALGVWEQAGFDFVWSIGLPSRMRTVETTLDAFEASLAPLRPGGLALHTFTFNLTSDQITWELPEITVLRRRDIEALAQRLIAKGHSLLPLNTHPGLEIADEHVRNDPMGVPGLRQRNGMLVSTSFGLAIRKGG